jgi:hypothetical protein
LIVDDLRLKQLLNLQNAPRTPFEGRIEVSEPRWGGVQAAFEYSKAGLETVRLAFGRFRIQSDPVPGRFENSKAYSETVPGRFENSKARSERIRAAF